MCAGSSSWFAALGSGLVSAARLGDYETVDRLFALALGTEHAAGAEAAQLVCLRYFAGLSVEEAGELIGLPRSSAYEHWSYARAWLHCQLYGP